MTLRIFDRMATLLRADAHGVLEALEERSLLLKQHLREAELELLQKRARLDGLNGEDERLTSALERRTAEAGALDEDVRLALAGGKDDLAKFAIRRLLPKRREVEALTAARSQVREARDRLADKLAEQEHAFEELRDRVNARLAESRDGAPARADEPPVAVTDEEVELELLRRQGEQGGTGS